MSPESAATRVARLEEQMAALVDRVEQNARMIDALAPTATTVAGHSIRLDDVTVDLSEIKVLMRRLGDDCARASDVKELKRAIDARSEQRIASRGIIIAAAITGTLTVFGSVTVTLLTVLT